MKAHAVFDGIAEMKNGRLNGEIAVMPEADGVAQLKIAFVQDALPYWGGAEQVLSAALEAFPQAELYTLIYRQEAFTGTPLQNHPVKGSALNHWPGAQRHHQLYLPLMPIALEQLDLDRFEVVLSFSYAVAHAAPTRPGQLHLSYMHTPLRYAWRREPLPVLIPGLDRLMVWLSRPLFAGFRRWDQAMANRTDRFLANSHWMAEFIQAIYRRPVQVLYPPVHTLAFRRRMARENYYLYVGRLAAHKRVDLLVRAFNYLGMPLWIVGAGPEETRLQAMACPNVRFLGWQPQTRLVELFGRAKAFVHAGEEDFGIAMAEAQAAGCPVIALGRGGAAEIVLNGQTGVLFVEQTAGSLSAAIEDFERLGVALSPEAIQAWARRFDRGEFQRGMHEAVVSGLAMKRLKERHRQAGLKAEAPFVGQGEPTGRAYGYRS